MYRGFSNLFLAKSRIHGIGIYSKTVIEEHQGIFVIRGRKVRFVPESSKDSAKWPNWIGIGKHQWIDPDPPGSYINHSCVPTAGIRGSTEVVAMRKIVPGKEITIDYSTTEEDPFWQMVCNCKERGCRKTLRSISFIPSKIIQKYGSYVPSNLIQFRSQRVMNV